MKDFGRKIRMSISAWNSVSALSYSFDFLSVPKIFCSRYHCVYIKVWRYILYLRYICDGFIWPLQLLMTVISQTLQSLLNKNVWVCKRYIRLSNSIFYQNCFYIWGSRHWVSSVMCCSFPKCTMHCKAVGYASVFDLVFDALLNFWRGVHQAKGESNTNFA